MRRQRRRASSSSSYRGARVPEGVQLRLSLAGATCLRNVPQETGSSLGQQKGEQKKKIIEDKTFHLKNKKGAKQQKFIKAVTHQVKFGQQNPCHIAQSEAEKKLKKDDKKKELQELNELFKPVVAAQKISKGKLYVSKVFLPM